MKSEEEINILMVDDCPENLLALEAVLASPNYNLVRANSGEEALKHVIKDDFAVILLDVQMPGLDGFETAKLIKAREKSKNIPIVFITAISQEKEHVTCGYSSGAIDYIFKPFNPETLRLKVAGFAEIYQNQKQVKLQSEQLKQRTTELEEINQKLLERFQSNILDRELLEKEMARLEQLNVVGEMAAGIAHEVRNPMTVVRGFLQMSKNKPDNLSAKYLDLMMAELDRANAIISEFLALAKNKKIEWHLHDLNQIIEAVVPLIQAEASHSDKYISLELGKCPPIYVDEKEIRQLILNLVINGLEAMAAGGTITVKTYAADQNVVLEIQDQGSGINQELLEKIWTPFFTTKEKGTGLGLSVCFSIVARHNGKIDVRTTEQGTTFIVCFQI